MDINLLASNILRIIHIFSGMIWVGFGVLVAFVMHPVAKQRGEKGLSMLRTFYAHSRFNLVLSTAILLTTVAGLALWPLRTLPGTAMDFATLPASGDMVIALGALFGLLAFGHSFFATRTFISKFAKAARDYEASATDPLKQALDVTREKLFLHSNISAGLSIVAILCMSAARYLP